MNNLNSNFTSLNGISSIYSNEIINSDLISTNSLTVNGISIFNMTGYTGYVT